MSRPVKGNNLCRECCRPGHNARTCGRPPKVKKSSGGQRGPRPRDPSSSLSLRYGYGRIAAPVVVDAAREAAVQAMIDRHHAAKLDYQAAALVPYITAAS